MSSVVLALVGMLCWGVGPIFAKLGLGGVDPLTGLCARTMTAGILVSVWSIMASRSRHFQVVPLKALVLITVEAIFATVIGDLAYYAALKKGNCGEVSVILSASPAVTIMLSIFFLGEKPSVPSLLGASFITFGLILVGLQAKT